MKIAILTFHRALNYGAVLQVYALSKYLEDNGHEAIVIDYRNKLIEKKYQSFPFYILFERKNIFKSLKIFTKKILSISIQNKKRNKFYDFISKNLKVDSRIASEGAQIPNDFEMYLVGSDQVWNNSITGGFDEAYFLKYPTNKNVIKASYAASLEQSNHKFINENKEAFLTNLNYLDKVSVREVQIEKLIKSISNKEVETVVDPTLLLSSSVYEAILEQPKERGYVLVYHLSTNKDLLISADKIAKNKNLDIIEIYAGINPYIKGERYKQDLSPNEFLGYFKFADFVITSSFHGTCFSIIFNKQFYVISNHSSDRQSYLLQSLNISNRMISSSKDVQVDELVDFLEVGKQLETLKKHSINFLNEVLAYKK
jgi:hypothetical protein